MPLHVGLVAGEADGGRLCLAMYLVLGNCRLPNIDAELEQFPMDARGAPKWIGRSGTGPRRSARLVKMDMLNA